MTQIELYNALNDEQKQLHKYLEENDRRVYLFEQDGQICAEVENWTNGGVDMIINCMPFCVNELQNYLEGFDIDEEIDLYRESEDYRNAFTIRQSLEDFEGWRNELEMLICDFEIAVA